MRTPGCSSFSTALTAAARALRLARLEAWLVERGFDVVTCRDPGGTALGDRLRSILLDRETVPISMRAEMLLYMASRAQLVEDVIAPALGRRADRDLRPLSAREHRLSGDCRGPAGRRDRHGGDDRHRRAASRPDDRARHRTGAGAGAARASPATGSRTVRSFITSGFGPVFLRQREARGGARDEQARECLGLSGADRADRCVGRSRHRLQARFSGRSSRPFLGEAESWRGTRFGVMIGSWNRCEVQCARAVSARALVCGSRRASASARSRASSRRHFCAKRGPRSLSIRARNARRAVRSKRALTPTSTRPASPRQARAADQRDSRPVRSIRHEAGPRVAQGGDPRRRRRPERRGLQRVLEDARRAAAGGRPDPDRHVGRAAERDDRLALQRRAVRPAARVGDRRALAGNGGRQRSAIRPIAWLHWAKEASAGPAGWPTPSSKRSAGR